MVQQTSFHKRRFYKGQFKVLGAVYCEVSVNVVTGCPRPYGPSAVTVTLPAVEGSVSVTAGVTPEPLVTSINLAPLLVPSESVPALAVNRMLAPVFVPPDEPTDNVTVNGVGRAVPSVPVCPSPVVFARVAAGLPTMIHPPSVWVAVPSFPVTVKWQNPGVLPAFTVISPGTVGVIVEVVSVSVPLHAAAPSYASNTADERLTLVDPVVIFGFNVIVPLAATMVVSGFRSHDETGEVVVVPVITSMVAV